MKNFLTAICLCFFLSILGLVFLLPSTKAEENVLQNLLNLPSPPPANPLVEMRSKRRNANFYSPNNPPGDDASPQDLLDFWMSQNGRDERFTYKLKPSDKTVDKLKSEIEKNPEKLSSFINNLPEDASTVDFVKRLYEKELAEDKYGVDWQATIKTWLTYNTNTFSDQLEVTAKQVKDSAGYVTNQYELLTLAKVDWDKAQPILQALLNDSSQPVSQTLARWAFYQHAISTNSTGDIDKYRSELKAAVEDKSASAGVRDLAMDALVRVGDFPGRDDWYYSLLGDETLHDLKINGQTYTGLTTLLNQSPSDKYSEKMIELTRSSNQTVRNAAVRNLSTLIDENNIEVIRALLPWLEDRKWAKEIVGNERQQIVNALRTIVLPESVSGLLQVLNEKQTNEVRVYPNSNTANVAMNVAVDATRSVANSAIEMADSAAGGRLVNVDSYPLRSSAIAALEIQKDQSAAGPLRLVLPDVQDWERISVVRAMLACNAFSIQEQVNSLETTAKFMSKQNEAIQSANVAANSSANTVISAMPMANRAPYDESGFPYGKPYNPSQIPQILGMQLVNWQNVSDELITAVIDRIQNIEKKEPKIAATLRQIIRNWNGKGINTLMLRDLKAGKADMEIIVKLLSLRKELREKQQNEIFDIRGGSPIALGISACLLEDNSEYDATLGNENVDTKIALLGCARLIRADLPVARVAEYLRNPNKLLALAAEKYLESVDTPEARGYVLAVHPNEAKVLGARTSFSDENSGYTDSLPQLFTSVNEDLYYQGFGGDELDEVETRLKKEVKENSELIGVYSYDSNFVRIYRDKAVFSREEDSARYRERTLEAEEFNNLKSFLTYEKVDQLPPFVGDCERYCVPLELLMIGRNGGRRVYLRIEEKPKFFAELDKIFDDMRKPQGKLHYWLEKYAAGLEVLFEDERLQARTLWKNGTDLSILVEDAPRRKEIDKEIAKQEEQEALSFQPFVDADYTKIEEANRKRREARNFEEFSWRKFGKDGSLEMLGQPNEVEFIPRKDGSAINSSAEQWKARTPNFEVRSSFDGVYKVTRGQATKLRGESYYQPFVSPNGKWLIASKYGDDAVGLVRINLLTNKEYKVVLPEFPTIKVVAFVPSVNKFLVLGGYYYEEHEEPVDELANGAAFMFDPETGIMLPAKGEVRPLLQQTFRPLQSTGILDEYWAAIVDGDSTKIGRFNAKLMTFKAALNLPKIKFTSMEMFVDEKENKVYFVYQGHLLSVPITKPVQNLPSR